MQRFEAIYRFASVGAGLLLMTTVLACGGSTPTTPTNPGTGTPPPTPAPAPTPTPAPGPAPAPAPGPAPAPPSNTIDILRSQGAAISVKGNHGNLARAQAGYDVRGRTAGGYPGRSLAETMISVGSGEHPVAKSWVYYDWDSAPGAYRVSADVQWLGYLTTFGIGGSGAKMTYELEVRDFRGRLLVSRTLHEREVRESAISGGVLKDQGSTSAAVDFTLPANTGGPFRIFLILTCESYSGILGTSTSCLYGNNPDLGKAGLDGYAEWTALSVTTFR